MGVSPSVGSCPIEVDWVARFWPCPASGRRRLLDTSSPVGHDRAIQPVAMRAPKGLLFSGGRSSLASGACRFGAAKPRSSGKRIGRERNHESKGALDPTSAIREASKTDHVYIPTSAHPRKAGGPPYSIDWIHGLSGQGLFGKAAAQCGLGGGHSSTGQTPFGRSIRPAPRATRRTRLQGV